MWVCVDALSRSAKCTYACIYKWKLLAMLRAGVRGCEEDHFAVNIWSASIVLFNRFDKVGEQNRSSVYCIVLVVQIVLLCLKG